MDDEIDLIELIQIFWQHRIKFIVMALLGLILGLSFSFTHKPEYTTDFSFTVGHPLFTNEVLNKSVLLQKTLNDSNLNPGILPNYSYKKKTQTYTVRSNTADIQATVQSLLTHALREDVEQLKKTAATVTAYDQNQIIFTQNNTLIQFSNQDMANLDTQAVIKSLKFSFSKTKVLYPHPFKHGLIGIVIGLALGFVWMVRAILTSKMNTADLKRKA